MKTADEIRGAAAPAEAGSTEAGTERTAAKTLEEMRSYAQGVFDGTEYAVAYLYEQARGLRSPAWEKFEWADAIESMAGHLSRRKHIPQDAGLRWLPHGQPDDSREGSPK